MSHIIVVSATVAPDAGADIGRQTTLTLITPVKVALAAPGARVEIMTLAERG